MESFFFMKKIFLRKATKTLGKFDIKGGAQSQIDFSTYNILGIFLQKLIIFDFFVKALFWSVLSIFGLATLETSSNVYFTYIFCSSSTQMFICATVMYWFVMVNSSWVHNNLTRLNPFGMERNWVKYEKVVDGRSWSSWSSLKIKRKSLIVNLLKQCSMIHKVKSEPNITIKSQ